MASRPHTVPGGLFTNKTPSFLKADTGPSKRPFRANYVKVHQSAKRMGVLYFNRRFLHFQRLPVNNEKALKTGLEVICFPENRIETLLYGLYPRTGNLKG
jgi:hypothetical protein